MVGKAMRGFKTSTSPPSRRIHCVSSDSGGGCAVMSTLTCRRGRT
jgi:hypothetical protein